MIDLIFEMIRYVLTLSFGIFTAALFLDIRAEKKSLQILFAFFAIDGILQGALYYSVGFSEIVAIYPLITHLPLVLLFIIAFKKRIFAATISVTAAYMSCQIANWMSTIAITLGMEGVTEDVIYSLSLVMTFIVILKYVAEPIAGLLNKPDKSLITFGIIPIAYYVFDYIVTIYTELLYEGNMIAVEFSPLLLCILYIVFCATYFKQYEQRQEVDNRNRLVQMKFEHSKKEIETIKRNEKDLALIRHDMRHFLSVLSEYIDNGETDKARDYIYDVVESLDKTTRKKYCSNENINMILSCYESYVEENNIDFQYTLQVSAEIAISDVDMTSILSNCLENAIKEVSSFDEGKPRKIELKIIQKNEKLLISMRNPYKVKPKFIGDMPVSCNEDHGYGTQSIRYTVEKLNGNCQFSADKGQFTVQIIL
ncbi:MAG: sensor histidine kinase [Firmicutes bacterium]|nr:sensor histidine kinase [Bacillota bacterium]